MDLQRIYRRTRFPPDVIAQAIDTLRTGAGDAYEVRHDSLRVDVDADTTWSLDSFGEWAAAYRNATGTASLRSYVFKRGHDKWTLEIRYMRRGTEVRVDGPERQLIAAVQEVFASNADSAKLPEPPPDPPTIFVGHGRNQAWRDLCDHLRDHHHYDVQAFESGARAGHAVRDIVESIAEDSTFAVLVMTGDDATADGGTRARQNVVHEIGLFQGHLGWDRAIVLLEKGVEGFSNMDGIIRIEFEPGRIRETFGDVLAVLRREFGPPPAN